MTARPSASDSKQVVITLEDISEYKRARESLRASEARLEIAMEASELSMWDWNVELDEVSYNDQWRISLGIEPRELLKREALADRLMLPPDDARSSKNSSATSTARRPYFECEYRLPTRDGTHKWFLRARQGHASRRRRQRHSASSACCRISRVANKISAPRSTWSSVGNARSAARPTDLYEWDLLTGHVWYASRFRDIVGCGDAGFPEHVPGISERDASGGSRRACLAKIRAHLENQSRLDLRCRVVTRGGTIVWCRLRGEAERDAAGRPTRLAGSLSDISAQIEAEKALSRSQDFYGTVLDSLPLFVAYADRDERIVYANRMFQTVLRRRRWRTRAAA